MAQRGCDACPDIDNTARAQIVRPNGTTAYYHLGCRPVTVHNTDDLHPRMAQLVHAHEQAVGVDLYGNDLGGVGVLMAQGVEHDVESMTVGGRLIGEVSEELEARDKETTPS